MKFYRVGIRVDNDKQDYEWFLTKEAAHRRAKETEREDTTVIRIDVPTTKVSLRSWLDAYVGSSSTLRS